MAVTKKAVLCFWLLMLLALSSEEVRVSDAADCILIIHPFCKHDGDCDDPCMNETNGHDGYIYTQGRCRDWSCFCCAPDHQKPRAPGHQKPHTPGHSVRKLAS